MRDYLAEVAAEFSTCLAFIEPDSAELCGLPADFLLVLVCSKDHRELASMCSHHHDVALMLPPGALSHCALCEEGIEATTSAPMAVGGSEPFADNHDFLIEIAQVRADLDSL